MLPRLLQIEQQSVVQVDVAFFFEVGGQLAQHQFIEGGAVVDALDLGLYQLVEVADRGVQVDRWVNQQHLLEVETATGLIQFADEGRIQCAEAVTGQVKVGDLQ